MTRDHASQYTPAPDEWAAHRCVNCHPHLFYADDVLGGDCRWRDLGCGCTDHRPAGEREVNARDHTRGP